MLFKQIIDNAEGKMVKSALTALYNQGFPTWVTTEYELAKYSDIDMDSNLMLASNADVIRDPD